MNSDDAILPRRAIAPPAPSWLFYGYNVAFNNHEGDRERVAAQLVDGVTFCKHDDPVPGRLEPS